MPEVVKAMQEGNIASPSLIEVASHTKNCHSANYYYIMIYNPTSHTQVHNILLLANTLIFK
jgi:hypothetical protein